MPIVSKQKSGWVVARFVASETIFLNTSTPLRGCNNAGELVTAANIISAEWSIGNNAYWQVQRGANTVLLLTDGQHCFEMTDSRVIDNIGGEPQSNVVVTKVGSGPGTLILKLHKKSSISGGSTY